MNFVEMSSNSSNTLVDVGKENPITALPYSQQENEDFGWNQYMLHS